jgi:choline dehydrogenase-like flavoprotein
VDESFRVHGYDNLYVCDASVFPGSVQVNPQMTVMSLARYAATRIE